MKILVTGASGFVGQKLVGLLGERGHAVYGVDVRAGSGKRPDKLLDLRDAEAVAALPASFLPEAVVHAGAISGPMLFHDRPAFVADANIGATLNLLEMSRINGVGRFVFCSSIAVYGDRKAGEPISEEVPLVAETPYSASKVAGEALTQCYGRRHGVSGASVRIGRIYGPGRETDCSLRDLIRAGLDNGEVDLVAAEEIQHHIHVDDVARGLAAVAEAPSLPHEAYNLVAAEALTLTETAKRVHSLLPGLRFRPDTATVGVNREPSALSGARLRADCAFTPMMTLARGIEEYAAMLRRAGE